MMMTPMSMINQTSIQNFTLFPLTIDYSTTTLPHLCYIVFPVPPARASQAEKQNKNKNSVVRMGYGCEVMNQRMQYVATKDRALGKAKAAAVQPLNFILICVTGIVPECVPL